MEFKEFWRSINNGKSIETEKSIEIDNDKFKNIILDIMKGNPFLFLYEIHYKVKHLINYRKLILLISEIKEIKMIKWEGDDYKKSWVYLK